MGRTIHWQFNDGGLLESSAFKDDGQINSTDKALLESCGYTLSKTMPAIEDSQVATTIKVSHTDLRERVELS